VPIFEISTVPTGTGETSVSRFVRRAVEIIKAHGLEYQVNPMGTCIQCDWETALATIQAIHDEYERLGCRRTYTVVKIDDRRDRPSSMQAKVDAVVP
jgi:uncharacterized protein (TIGR00106 family)